MALSAGASVGVETISELPETIVGETLPASFLVPQDSVDLASRSARAQHDEHLCRRGGVRVAIDHGRLTPLIHRFPRASLPPEDGADGESRVARAIALGSRPQDRTQNRQP